MIYADTDNGNAVDTGHQRIQPSVPSLDGFTVSFTWTREIRMGRVRRWKLKRSARHPNRYEASMKSTDRNKPTRNGLLAS